MNTLNQLITIATVSQEFRQMLLTNPSQALKQGYQGKSLEISHKDQEILLRSNAKSLSELAKYILESTDARGTMPATVLIASEYPAITKSISSELKTNNYHVSQINRTILLNQPQKADLILLCSTEPPIEFCTKLLPLYPKKLALLTDLKTQKIPHCWFGKIALISLKEQISQIVHTISQIISQDSFYSPLATSQLLNKTNSTQINIKETELTNQEKNVYYLLNLSNKEIAHSLRISISTVRTHIQQINQKMGFNVRKSLNYSLSKE